MEDQYLTPHFKLSEFINSPTAKARGIDNTPTVAIVNNLKLLCIHVLEPLRQAMGVPITISSGYRCPALNKAVRGKDKSKHLTGHAADIHLPDNTTGKIWFNWIMNNCKFYKLIWECSSEPRGKSSSLELSRGDGELRRSQIADNKHFWIHVSYVEGECKNYIVPYLLKG